jgi:DNA repair protein RecO (recombination protein O)
MIQKATSIAVHSLKYGENSLIAYIYTKEFGRITLMVNSAFGRGKTRGKAVFFQPLTLLDIVFYPGRNHGMGRLKEVAVSTPHNTLHTNHIKRAISLFIGEVIYRSIREEESNFALFNFLELSIRTLDALDNGVSNFHLLFLAQLSKYLGFFPHGNYSEITPYFDYKNGHFAKSEPLHPIYFPRQYGQILSMALETPYNKANELLLNGEQRSEFLTLMLKFYAFHLDSIQYVNSLSILAQVFDE